MSDEQQLCGAEISVDWNLDFECELAPGHPGDHQAAYMWSNEPIGPKLPPTPNRFLSALWAESLHAAYGKMLTQQLAAAGAGSPFVNPDTATRQAANRDQL